MPSLLPAVLIPASEIPQLCYIFINQWGLACSLYIAVVSNPSSPPGFTSQFSLLADLSGSQSSPILLEDGIMVADLTPYRAYSYFFGTPQPQPSECIYVSVSNAVGQTDIFLNIGFNSSGFATAETGGITDADYYVPAGNAYETIIICPSSTARAPPPFGALGSGITFSRTESAVSGLTYDRVSIPFGRTLSEEFRRSLHSFRTPAPPGRAVSLDLADVAAGVNLASIATARSTIVASSAAHPDWADIKFGGHPSGGLRTPVVDPSAPIEPVSLARDSAPVPRAAQVVPPPHPLGPGNWCSGCPMYLSVRSTTPQYSFFSVLYTADAMFIPVCTVVGSLYLRAPQNGDTPFPSPPLIAS